ncbi:ShlB/FhaC/HecB family hemolysin secretion/activation protein [Pseudomonas massiliensis]|uniref:ShlB/FhaC/HecB family hemolysin secretion/activation protein n=1 Tax=Pseudomonas massiliensis TaxID=522492 RepID=UPI0006948981|nr:ShlB/FhaC/HecB family hemolysin secretion/activation protein [Pseudomonas massiliensis]
MLKFRTKLSNIVLACALVETALAETPGGGSGFPALPPTLLDAPQRFIQDSEQRREAIEAEQRQRQLERQPPPSPRQPAPPPSSQDAPDAPCWYLTGISVQGNRLVSDSQVQHAVRPLLRPCMGPMRINRILAAITRLYTEAGYVASRPVLLSPPADQQPLALVIEEGFVEAIELADQELPVNLGAAFPGMIGQPLQLRALEQGLDQLNRLRSVDLVADIAPGQYQGGTKVALRAASRPPRWQVDLGMDNQGSASTGRQRISLSASVDSPLERNDFFSLHGARSRPSDTAGSETLGLNYNIPYGPWSLSLAANQFRYKAQAPGLLSVLPMQGTSHLFSYALERGLWRDQSRLLSATLRLDDKRISAGLAGHRIALQSPRYQSLELGLNGLWVGRARWAGYVGHGLGLGGWREDDAGPRKQPGARSARYRKWRLSLVRSSAHELGGRYWTLASQWTGQYSQAPMPASESLGLGGSSLVRGFRERPIDTGSALAWRNTLALPLALDHGFRLSPSLGLDAGWAEGRGRASRSLGHVPIRGERLLGGSLGATLEHRHGALALEYQRALYRRNAPLDGDYWQLAVHLRY